MSEAADTVCGPRACPPPDGSGIMGDVLALVDALLIVAFGLVLGYLGNHRFEAMERRIDRLEDRMDQRFERLIGEMNGRFGEMNGRFGQVDDRCGELIGEMNGGFARVDQRSERLEQRLDSGLDAVRADITRLAVALVPPRGAGQG